MKATIANLIKGKHKPYTIHSDDTIFNALKIMAEKDIGFLLVVDGHSMVGVVSERDYARKVDLIDKDSRTTKVSEIMTREVISIRPEQTSDEAMALMTQYHIRHLPVLIAGKLVAVISMGDVVKACLRSQKETIDFLEDMALDK
jgi:IMP dehydrogenase